MEKTKTCKICGRILPLSEFHKQSITKDGHTTVCKVCVSVKSLKYRSSIEFKIKQKEYNQTHKERNTFLRKRWKENHPEKAKEYNKKYRDANTDKIKESIRKWRRANPEKEKESRKRWREANREKLKEYDKNIIKSLKKSYVVNLLLKMGFSREDITLELIETQRTIIRTKRILWNK